MGAKNFAEKDVPERFYNFVTNAPHRSAYPTFHRGPSTTRWPFTLCVAQLRRARLQAVPSFFSEPQKPGYPADALPFVVTVEPCKTSALKRALASVSTMDCMLVEPLDLQMLE